MLQSTYFALLYYFTILVKTQKTGKGKIKHFLNHFFVRSYLLTSCPPYLYFAASKRGKGARVKGNFHLKRGEVLKILVGQEGGVNTVSGGAGGGGGTFVVTDGNTPLLIGE